ncbi:NXPE family member 1-like isoform X1 [Conger conger]|uniref:NXPE family member 1-like isoform X1 n=2 Tax=Conger conger TaxID=82655 RepID=UPI002A5AD0A7|nr:NXPE family member 1-like isoform X1 [Conger conger]
MNGERNGSLAPVGKANKSTSTVLPSAVGHHFWTRSKMKCAFTFLCAMGLFCIIVYELYNWTSVLEQYESPHKEVTVDEIMLALSWAASPANFTSITSSSSAERSVVRLEHPEAQYCVGDTLSVLVEMKSYAGHPKAHGGDFIQARILSPKLNAGASGDVTDFLNGSYLVRYRLFWPGEVQVSVRLIHSSETVKLLQRNWTQDYNKAVHTGTFISGAKKETSLCSLRLGSDRPLCEYRKKEDGEYYACYRPKTLPCDTLALASSVYPRGYPRLTKEEAQLLDMKNSGIEIKNGFHPVTVFPCTGATYGSTKKCVAGMNSPFPGGYLFSNRWSSSFCQTGFFLSEYAVTRCLKGKTLYLLGDSTARQWIEYLEQRLKGMKFTLKGADLQLAVDANNNITIRWIRHAHPWVATYQSSVNASVTIPEALDSIAVVGGGQEDVIVVIGTGQHFRPSPPEVFIRRLLNIRRAILRLQARCPQAQVFIKLENNRDIKLGMIRFSNWYGYMQNLAQRKVFEDMRVALVDAWDMTVATYSLKLHPDNFIVSNQIAVALSFFCD